MAQNADEIRARLDRYLAADFRGRLRARGFARGMVWRDGVLPDGSAIFPESLSVDLLDFGYGVLALALELRDANLTRRAGDHFITNDALELAAETIESAVRRGAPSAERGRHLVTSAAAFHLAGYAARSYSLLPLPVLSQNLASCERALALLLRRDLAALRETIVGWHTSAPHSDDAVAKRIADETDDFGAEDAILIALTTWYFKALGLADSALILGYVTVFERATQELRKVVDAAAKNGNIPLWWVATLTQHLLRDLWEHSLHTRLPSGPIHGLPPRWDALRRAYILQLVHRRQPHVDLWPSQLEAVRRSIDPRDDLVIALPTSAGKTKIAEFCILRTLMDRKRAVYVTPLRALSAQVERVLARTFIPLGASVSSLYGAIGASSVDEATLGTADIIVATPEKLDFALRQDPNVLNDVALVVLDEGHMIGLGSREIRYEALIQRLLRRPDAEARRVVCLSAMFNPDDAYFKDFSAWLRSDLPGDPVHVKWRPTRQRLARLEWIVRDGSARLSFLEGEEAFVSRFVEQQPPRKRRKKPFPTDEKELCIAAADAFARDGHSILVYSPQRSQIDPLVREFTRVHKQGYLRSILAPDPAELITALAIGREWLGEQHAAVEALHLGVGTHHGALPRPFQSAIEALLERKKLPVVVASPTLAQGVDLSCSVLLFRGITRFDPETKLPKPITPAEFANVVGRAGRAYVDLDGIVALPIYESGTTRSNRRKQFDRLIEESRGPRMLSGLAHLVHELAARICAKLDVSKENFLEYVTNHTGFWSDERLSDNGQVEEDEESTRSLGEYVADLDVAILSLIERLDADPQELAGLLDDVLSGSLWKRTLAHLKDDMRRWEREVIVSRAQWLWNHTTAAERRACFSSGLGAAAGTFLYRNLDSLVDVLADLHAAILSGLGDLVRQLAVSFAEVIIDDKFFFPRPPPDNWKGALSSWVNATGFAAILSNLGQREANKIEAFVQDSVAFRLVWAAEAVRVQAISTEHARAEELGEGPMLAFTYGVPTLPAALLCQAGYASRTGAVWVTNELSAAFTDSKGMKDWMDEHEAILADSAFWKSDDHRVLWNHIWRPTRGDFPRPWNQRKVVVEPTWSAVASEAVVRLLPRSDRTALICAQDLTVLGEVTLPFNPEGAALEATIHEDGLEITYFGPN